MEVLMRALGFSTLIIFLLGASACKKETLSAKVEWLADAEAYTEIKMLERAGVCKTDRSLSANSDSVVFLHDERLFFRDGGYYDVNNSRIYVSKRQKSNISIFPTFCHSNNLLHVSKIDELTYVIPIDSSFIDGAVAGGPGSSGLFCAIFPACRWQHLGWG